MSSLFYKKASLPHSNIIYFDARVDGGCRRTGNWNALGAAAAVFFRHGRDSEKFCEIITPDLRPTSQRAELRAVILALKTTLREFRRFETDHYHPFGKPTLELNICSDSQYALCCVTDWPSTWDRSGNVWRNSKGNAISNQDLFEEALGYDSTLRQLGVVRYLYIFREDNAIANKVCNEEMDKYEGGEHS